MIYRRNHTKEEIVKMIKAGEVNIAGCNGKASKDKTYGEIWGKSLETGKKCSGATALKNSAIKNPSGSTQVFFIDEAEALNKGFRPCGYCFPSLKSEWEAAPDKDAWKQKRLAAIKKG